MFKLTCLHRTSSSFCTKKKLTSVFHMSKMEVQLLRGHCHTFIKTGSFFVTKGLSVTVKWEGEECARLGWNGSYINCYYIIFIIVPSKRQSHPVHTYIYSKNTVLICTILYLFDYIINLYYCSSVYVEKNDTFGWFDC